MHELELSENRDSNWWKELLSTLRNGWLTTAIVVEVLGLVAAFATIPGLPFPTALMLTATGILSAAGVLIVTVYFMLQYNRRRLNYIQVDEVKNMLAPHISREEAQGSFVPKSELSALIEGFGLFWQWRYQSSVMEFAWASRELRGQPGYVLVATLEGFGSPAARIRHFLVPPPTQDLSDPLDNNGERVPNQYSEWGKIFGEQYSLIVLYEGADQELRYLIVREQLHKVLFNDRTATPIVVPENRPAQLPRLKKVGCPTDFSWAWETP